MHWTKHSLNSALARCRHPSRLDLLASQFFVLLYFSIYIGVRTIINQWLLPCLLSAWCCRRPKRDSHRTEQAKLKLGGGEEERCMEIGLCKARTLRAAGMKWTDQEELSSKQEG